MKHHSRRAYLNQLNADINVVPYIDVMLVLLVIFMITAPLLTQGVKVNLPQASSQPLKNKQQPLILSVDKNGLYYLNSAAHPNKPLSKTQLQQLIRARLTSGQQAPSGVYVKGDHDVQYGRVVQAMVALQQAGASDVGLITEDNANSASSQR